LVQQMTGVIFQISTAPLANLKFPVLFLSPFRQMPLIQWVSGAKAAGAWS